MKAHFKEEGAKQSVCGRPAGGTAKGSVFCATAAMFAEHDDLTRCEHCAPAIEAAIQKGVEACSCFSCGLKKKA